MQPKMRNVLAKMRERRENAGFPARLRDGWHLCWNRGITGSVSTRWRLGELALLIVWQWIDIDLYTVLRLQCLKESSPVGPILGMPSEFMPSISHQLPFVFSSLLHVPSGLAFPDVVHISIHSESTSQLSLPTSTFALFTNFFQIEAATALSANNELLIKLDRVSCTNCFMSIHNIRRSVKPIKIAKRDTRRPLSVKTMCSRCWLCKQLNCTL